ncbi:endo-beta-N-acetylglucosaminidase [Enterococcus sp. 5H]|uniref:endo-beta-N-acetylglucosaminidase n=1 Tax=Enterococcus sp. 5H TaxID=1229490 RepID=UPI002302A063|nr:discoidin domain-containing protein [Enterococcus sp. 5H]MDA9471349.1 endo-beta-N-acetylglucosaminidase [Enterococcus sp. 5H]
MARKKLKQVFCCSTALAAFFMGASLLSMSPVYAESEFSAQSESGIPIYDHIPESTALFPETLLNWSAKTDPDAPFNVSRIPLTDRIKGEKTNADQSTEAKVLSIAIVNRHTKGTPSQGDTDKAVYNFTNWQYVDTLVAWAGSSGEGIIVPPSGDVTDSAHRNGVPVVGTVFFPPEAYGGKAEWVRQFVQKDAKGNFPMADKLLEMSVAYGFDGWFINQETNVDAQTAAAMKELLIYLQTKKPKNQQIIWYDSMIPSGSVNWQGALNDQNKGYFQDGKQRVSDKLFIDFRWRELASSKAKAEELKRDPYDLYAGIDVQANGINSSRKPSSILGSTSQPLVSLGLYCPDWTLRDGGQYDVDRYWENEKLFWINAQGDPRDVTSTKNEWQGVSRYFVEKTPVTAFPFLTNFNVGNGDAIYQNGTKVKEGTFNNRSIQDVMPTYRWVIDNQEGNQLEAAINYDDAFNGGSSIGLSGQMTAGQETFIKLYAAQVKPSASEKVSVVTKGADQTSLVLGIKGKQAPLVIQGDQQALENGWVKTTYSLKSAACQTITSIGLNVKNQQTGPAAIYLGQLLAGQEKTTSIAQVKNVRFPGKTIVDDLTESVRIQWDHQGKNTTSYRIYREEGGQSTFEGETANTAFTLLNQKRIGDTTNYRMVPVDQYGRENQKSSAVATYTFEALKKPEISINASSTLSAVGEAITLSANVSKSTEQVNWEIIGATPQTQSGTEITVTFDAPGNYSVKATAVNSSGETEVIRENYLYIYDQNAGIKKENLSILPSTQATQGSGYTNERESYRYALDGDLTTKWCDNGSEKPWMIADLGGQKTIAGFELFHAGAGGESPEWNTRDYDISVSNDGTNWTNIVQRRGNTENSSKDAIALVEARYVKLSLEKAEQNGKVARIYDWQIIGVNGTGIINQ